MVTSWTLRSRDSGRVLGEIVSDWNGNLVERHNLPDTFQATAPSRVMASLMEPGGGCTLEDDDGVRFSGPMTSYIKRGRGEATVTFTSDLIWLWDRIGYPVPGAAWQSQTADYDTRSGPAETVLLAYVNANAGPGALAARRVAGLTLPASSGRGGSAPLTVRFDNLGQLARDLAEYAGLRVLVRQTTGTTLQLELLDALDKTATARYGTDESGGPGILDDNWTLEVRSPDLTRALVAGGGEGAARVLRERSDAAAEDLWSRRIEALVDQRQTSDTDELDRAGDDAIRDGSEPVVVKCSLPDAPGMRLITDVPIGSLVSLDLDGDHVVDRLRQVTTTITADGSTRTGVVGSADAGLTREQKRFLKTRRALRKVQAT